eukprot:g3957.t1
MFGQALARFGPAGPVVCVAVPVAFVFGMLIKSEQDGMKEFQMKQNLEIERRVARALDGYKPEGRRRDELLREKALIEKELQRLEAKKGKVITST